MSPDPLIVIRTSNGISFSYGPPRFEPTENLLEDSSKRCKKCLFSPNGSYFAWTNGELLQIYDFKNYKMAASIPRPKVYSFEFSPNETYLATWEPLVVTTDLPQGKPNVCVFKTADGEMVGQFTHKKPSTWNLQWSYDEKLCGKLTGAVVQIFENGKFDRWTHQITGNNIQSFSISPNLPNYYVVCYVPGSNSQPNNAILYQYPNFQNTQALTNKSFFLKTDRTDFYWNSKGTSVLLLASCDVDTTGGSYYGKACLQYLNIKGDTAVVSLDKEGPIHHVQWSPNGNEFCVIYGFMPANVTLFNLKCDPIFQFGPSPRNVAHFNSFGNVLLLGGFGNLAGEIEIWDMNARKLINKMEARDTTYLEWSPNGIHFLTATTSPRLRMGNGYKIWHYSGTLLYERSIFSPEELLEIQWQQFPKNTFAEPVIDYKPVEGIQSSQPVASSQVYRAPKVRLGPVVEIKKKEPSKASLKLRKKREAKKAKREDEDNKISGPGCNLNEKKESKIESNDPEKDKKIKKIKQKLDAIEKLKQLQTDGKLLEINQLSKIQSEAELIKELNEISLS